MKLAGLKVVATSLILAEFFFRSVFGQRGSTKVIPLDTLQELGNNVRSRRPVTIPSSAKLVTNDIAAINGIGIMGLRLVAMEEDKRGKSVVRSRINQRASDLKRVLIEYIENSPAGWIRADQTREKIENELFGEGNDSPAFGERFGRWIGRYDDEIGQNTLILLFGCHHAIGELTEDHLERMGSGYEPNSRVDPVSLLKEKVFSLEFTGSDAKYQVDVEVSETIADAVFEW